jgi:hypothetical protein
MKPEKTIQNRVEALERRKALLDVLIKFVKAHPELANESSLLMLQNGGTGLKFPDYALIVPYFLGGNPALRLVKSGEDWQQLEPGADREVAEDVSRMSKRKIQSLLDQMFREANPDCKQEEDDEAE